ncbi:xanthine dehydrogenase family protein molybdopterin-binding subunit [Mucilaginibacter robiniae]|uniref:Xanthine dehydrogenase family protein molybdopterin-binding subunit n=1 Tax=Mucilaginibacter robiniae TaxID=2728022 RepID=A0A7L5DWY7_9SPHI|nr:xanthine dehydrogenase family protein molybdopterin-binding subunit [Mucilaginibacter robiniae]QJD95610.1 xanthine dehydrogenase family protein molybdopterin-binding subunit [Mucilaginibacter robiniae]
MSTPLVGQAVDRVDGRLKVTGAATYAAEFSINNLVHGVAVLSTVTKGHINTINTTLTKKAPGVIDVLTYKNAMQLHFPQGSDPGQGKFAEKDLLPLQSDRIFYDGQFVAVVIAETLEQAQHGASLLQISYDKQEPQFDLHKNMDKAYKPAKGLGGSEVQVKRGDAEQAMQSAAVKVEATYSTPVYHHNAMEPHATIATWEGDKLMVYDATQSVAGSQGLLSQFLSMPKEKVRVISYYIGGGFGSKGFQWPNTVVAAMAAKLVNRPVKLALTRQQVFTTGGRRSQTIQNVALGADASGKLTAIKHASTVETSFVEEFVETAGVATSMLYACPNVDVSHSLVRLNKGTPCPMRAPGEAPGTVSLEIAMDELAYKLNMDPVQLRLINYTDIEPQKNKPFSLKNLKACYQQGADAIGWSSRNPQPRSMREGKYLVGYGMATATYPANRSKSSAKAILYADGHAEFMCATQDIGTGTYTIMTQLAAETLNLPVDKVKVKLGDSDFPQGANSGGSQVTASVGPAIRAAAIGALGKVIEIAIADKSSPLYKHPKENVILKDGKLVLINDNSRGESYTEILGRNNKPQVEAQATTNVSTRETQEANPASGNGGDASQKESEQNPAVQLDQAVDRKKYSFHSFGAHFVKVLVDPELGKVYIDKVVGVMDIGKVMNQKTATNQIMGGQIFAIGMALMEGSEYDPNRGRIVTHDLANYLVPVHGDMGDFTVKFIDQPDTIISPIGSRGIGEIGITGMAAAVVNAVYHATGIRVRDLPVSPEKLLAGLPA